MLKSLTLGLALGGLMLTSPMTAMADNHEEAQSSSGITCIDIHRMNHSKVVDNQTIIIYMRGGPDYKMKLKNRCSGLAQRKTWAHDAKGHTKLCSVDVIKVPVSTVGGLARTNFTSCIIESFEEYDEKAEKAAKKAAEG